MFRKRTTNPTDYNTDPGAVHHIADDPEFAGNHAGGDYVDKEAARDRMIALVVNIINVIAGTYLVYITLKPFFE